MFFKRKKADALPPQPSTTAQTKTGVPADYGQAAKQAVVRFYSAATLCGDRLGVEAEGYEASLPPVRYLTPDIACGVAIDIGPSYQRVTQADLDSWGVTLDQALTDAAARRMAEPLGIPVVGGLAMVRDETLGPALWIRPDVAAGIVKGTPVMVGLSRQLTLLASDGDPDWLEKMASYVLAALNGDNWVESVTPTRWTGSGWESLTWEDVGVPRETDRAIALRQDGRNYGRVRPVLKKWLEARDEYPLTAAFQVFKTADGVEQSTVASVVNGDTEDNVIPRADLVTFAFTDGRPTVRLTWETVAAHCELTPLGLTPEWYAIGAIPDFDALDHSE